MTDFTCSEGCTYMCEPCVIDLGYVCSDCTPRRACYACADDKATTVILDERGA